MSSKRKSVKKEGGKRAKKAKATPSPRNGALVLHGFEQKYPFEKPQVKPKIVDGLIDVLQRISQPEFPWWLISQEVCSCVQSLSDKYKLQYQNELKEKIKEQAEKATLDIIVAISKDTYRPAILWGSFDLMEAVSNAVRMKSNSLSVKPEDQVHCQWFNIYTTLRLSELSEENQNLFKKSNLIDCSEIPELKDWTSDVYWWKYNGRAFFGKAAVYDDIVRKIKLSLPLSSIGKVYASLEKPPGKVDPEDIEDYVRLTAVILFYPDFVRTLLGHFGRSDLLYYKQLYHLADD